MVTPCSPLRRVSQYVASRAPPETSHHKGLARPSAPGLYNTNLQLDRVRIATPGALVTTIAAKPHRIEKIVIVGGGTAGWMTAAALQCFLGRGFADIHLVESEEIGTIGVGEATVPTLHLYNKRLGINEIEFVKQTQGTFKLGIDFQDWGRIGNRFFHGFGDYGPFIDSISPYQYWLKLRAAGDDFDLGDLSVPTLMAWTDRCAQPHPDPKSPFAAFLYAYQFDASLYARFLRGYAESRGVRRTNARIVDVKLRGEDGFVRSLVLDNGTEVGADLFIDCSGFIGLLIDKAMKVGFEDWTKWLPCDRALAVACEGVTPVTPYTRSTAREAGWQWRIPLQHRTGNGYVYCSSFISDEAAARTLLENLDGAALGAPRPLRFKAGRRHKAWTKNVVAIGLSSGFLEPLESTTIVLIQNAIGRLVEYFPDKDFNPLLEQEFNRQSGLEYERIRDFIIIHYCFTDRTDSELWKYCRAMELPDELQYKVDVFRERGRPIVGDSEGFKEQNWIAIYNGLGVMPRTYDSLADRAPVEQVRRVLGERRAILKRGVDTMPTHDQFIAKYFRGEIPSLA
ncbi:MAG: tryptophan 7-halogenase [Alphaproteobacteria bacterium]|nr:tryptophan 7-halogenase [Alphaproteobacteria bacterium]